MKFLANERSLVRIYLQVNRVVVALASNRRDFARGKGGISPSTWGSQSDKNWRKWILNSSMLVDVLFTASITDSGTTLPSFPPISILSLSGFSQKRWFDRVFLCRGRVLLWPKLVDLDCGFEGNSNHLLSFFMYLLIFIKII